MITNIYFVRHAHSVYTPEELKRPLSERGVKDAERVTEILSKEKINRVISSPYKRAIETVEGVASLLNQVVELEDGFKERKLAEISVDNFEESVLKMWNDFNFSFVGGESGYMAQQRGVLALEKILDRYNGENIVIGTHGNIMVLIMNYYNKNYNFDFWKELKMPDIYKLAFVNKNLIEVKELW